MSIMGQPASEEIGPWRSRFAVPTSDEPVLMTITAEMAGDWLDYRFAPGANTHKQRKSKAKLKIEQMAKLMAKGKFPLTHQGIAFDVNGWLHDGWHRLQALRLAAYQTGNPELSIRSWVWGNQDPATFDAIDVGTMRRAAQLYQGKYGGLVTSAVRYLTPGQIGKYNRSMTVAEQVEMAEQWPELAAWAGACDAAGRPSKGRVPKVQHLAVLAQAERSGHRDKIEAWVQGVTEGWDLGKGDVRGHLRSRDWRGLRLSPEDTYGLIAKAWNLYVVDRRMQLLSFSVAESVPEILDFWGPPQNIMNMVEENAKTIEPDGNPADH